MGRVIKAGELRSQPRSISKEVRAAVEVLAKANVEAARIRRESKDRIIDLALHMTSKIVGRTVQMDPSVLNDIYSRAIRAAGNPNHAVISVNPRDREACSMDQLALEAEFDIATDPAIERGGCIISAGEVHVDASLRCALELYERALKGIDLGGE